jgi:hypothetical protein
MKKLFVIGLAVFIPSFLLEYYTRLLWASWPGVILLMATFVSGIIVLIFGLAIVLNFCRIVLKRWWFRRIFGFSPAKQEETREALWCHVKVVLGRIGRTIEGLIGDETEIKSLMNSKDGNGKNLHPQQIHDYGKKLNRVKKRIKHNINRFYTARNVAIKIGHYSDRLKRDASWKEFLNNFKP